MEILENLTSFLKLKSFFFLIFSIIVLFTSCKKDEAEKVIQQDESLKYTRKWFDTIRTIPYMSELEIKGNKTFEYHGGACTSSWFSKGSWVLKNDTIILNSFEPKECHYLSEYGTMCRTIEEMKKIVREISIKDCDPNSDEEYEIFANEKFFLRNDTLIHVKQNKKCEGIDFAYSSKVKIR